MKPIETILNKKNRENIVMWVSLLYGGFAIILFLMDLYSVIWLEGSVFSQNTELRAIDSNFISLDVNHPDNNRFDNNHSFPGGRIPFGPTRNLFSPSSILVLVSGIISLASGLTIMNILRKHEIKKIKQETADYLLLPDEKKVIEVLKEGGYSLPQNKITKESGLNKVQVHRVLKRLESKGLIEKHEYGLTNKIVLKKELFE
ncbi:MAG: hypothetical protein WCW13_05885 [archaeon]|jgi:uncharacterized membrane protein